MKRVIVCLCGSTRFMQAFQEANLRETLAGRIVLSIGCDTKTDEGLGLGPEVKAELDRLHFDKIALSDEVLFLNVGGYMGESTTRELAYARQLGKTIRWLETPQKAKYLSDDEPLSAWDVMLTPGGYYQLADMLRAHFPQEGDAEILVRLHDLGANPANEQPSIVQRAYAFNRRKFNADVAAEVNRRQREGT